MQAWQEQASETAVRTAAAVRTAVAVRTAEVEERTAEVEERTAAEALAAVLLRLILPGLQRA